MSGRCRLWRIERVPAGEGTIVGWKSHVALWPDLRWPVVLVDGEEIEARPGTYEWSALPDPLRPEGTPGRAARGQEPRGIGDGGYV